MAKVHHRYNLRQLARKAGAKQDRIRGLAFDNTPGVRKEIVKMATMFQWYDREPKGEFKTGSKANREPRP